ncbi:MAG: TetR/AcrR family transcriptional regulator [Christensenellales bacterium]|jgi:AcrR family transcriptional regulator
MNLPEGDSHIAAKERILRASSRLFSDKGYDATRVNEIAQEAGVNKALIYYYFKNKEDILDTLLSSLSGELESISLSYVNKAIVSAYEEGSMRITSDGLSFADEEKLELFVQTTDQYHRDLVDHMLERSEFFRILMLESLHRGRNSSSIMDIFKMANNYENIPMYKNIFNALKEYKDYTGPGNITAYYFFFVFLPAVNFVCFFSEYMPLLGSNEKVLKESFVRTLGKMFPVRIDGSDIVKD